MPTEPQPRKQQVFSITSAAESQSAEIGGRERRYAISMAIRTVCFLLAVVFWKPILWLAVVFIAAALLLPYTSVILANAGVRHKGAGPSPFGPEVRGQIEGPRPPHDD